MNWLRSEDLKEEKVITTPWHYNTAEGGVLAPNRPVVGSHPSHHGDYG
jgi:hypothetical protein